MNNTINDWHHYYQLGQQNLLKGDMDSAYRFGRTCWDIISKSFNMGDTTGQVFMLKLLYKTTSLVFKTFEDEDCPRSLKRHVSAATQNFQAVFESNYYKEEVRDSAAFFLRKINKEFTTN